MTQPTRESDDRKAPPKEKAWASHIQAAQESQVAPHPKAEQNATKGP